ncbi:MAG: hypothetical protein NTX82_05455 [Candidatus Parcubacteria bacterium]|nr:hypothetical protein [Candidatus Parcubacteria bacterium]
MDLKLKNTRCWHELINKKFVAVYIALVLVLLINQVVFTVLLKDRETAKAATPPAFTLKVKQLNGVGANAKIMVDFDQNVYTTFGSSGALNNVDPDMVEGGGSAGLSIIAIDHIAGTRVAILTTSADLNVTVPNQVLISCNADQVYNSSNQKCFQTGTDVNAAATDLIAPTLSNWDLDMNAGTLALNFSEPMDFTFDFDETLLTIEDATAATFYTLTDSIGSWTAPGVFTVTLSPADINQIKAISGLAENMGNSYLTITDISGLKDAVQNDMVAGVNGVQVNIYTADTTLPTVSGNNLHTDFSGCTAPNLCLATEAIIFTWDNGAGGDNPTGYNGDLSSVSAELNHFSGSASQSFYDDGTHGDLAAGDGIWSYALAVSSTGDYSDILFYIRVADYAGNLSLPQCGREIVCACGDKVIADYTFGADLDCLTGGDGLVIDKDGITIDGGNHTITGTYATPGTDLITGQHGIINIDHSNITIRNLIIKDFFYGIAEGGLTGALSNITIQDSSVINTTKYAISFIFPIGIVIANSDTNIISGTTVTGYSTAIGMLATANNNISSNIVSTNGIGIDLSGGILPGALSFNSTIANNTIKLSNTSALKIPQIVADSTVTISGNTFLYNRLDIENAVDGAGVSYNYSNNHSSHNINNRMINFAAEPVTNLQLGVDTANFVFDMRDEAGLACPAPGCTYNIVTSPSEVITITPAGSSISGSFTPTKYGIYTLQITVTDSNGNVGKRNIPFYVYSVGGANDLATAETTYYFRPGVDSTHGQSKGADARSLLLTPPTAIETEQCSQWVINFIDELPDYPFGAITQQDFNFWGKSAGHSFSYLFRFWNSNQYVQNDIGAYGAYTYLDTNFSGLTWNMEYPYSWYHSVFEYGKPFLTNNNPYITSQVTQVPPDPFSTATITHTYTTTPAVKYFSNSDVLLLAANPSAPGSALATLVLDGTYASDNSINVTLANYKYPFSAEITRIDSDGTATLMASNVTTITTFNSVNMELTPNSGYVDVDIDTWQLAGDFYKKWTETGSIPLITVNHTVGDLLPNTLYSATVNGAVVSSGYSNGAGKFNFNYSSNSYNSLKTFEVGKAFTAGSLPHVDSPSVITNLSVKADSTGRVTITWLDPTDADLKEIVITETSANNQTQTIVIAAGKESAVLTGRAVGSEYKYFIRAVDISGLASTGVTITITIPRQGETQSGESVLSAPEEPSGLTLPDGVNVGDSIKVSNSTTVYFVDTDKRRHTFPNETTYFSYFSSFNGIKTISLSTLARITLGKNVTVRPGTWLVKIQSDPKVYAVEPYGVLRSISSQAVAAALYGADWNSKIADISPAFFVDYQIGLDVSTAVHPTGVAFSYQNDSKVYYVEQNNKRYISTEVFINNKFRDMFIIRKVSPDIAYANGTDLPNLNIEEIVTTR